jgi:prepilin-type N-terminal cleavage/methylation domain-containing protein
LGWYGLAVIPPLGALQGGKVMKRNQQGFTLVEIAIVLVIIGCCWAAS